MAPGDTRPLMFPAGTVYLSPPVIDARRAALEVEEEGLAGLVPVDRIIATVGGIIGGALVLAGAVGVAAARDALGLRRQARR